MAEDDPDRFTAQCGELGSKVLDLIAQYPKSVGICVLPAVMASLSKVFSLPRSAFIQMMDSALEDVDE